MEETLGKRIAFHRKRLSLTQDALAVLLGVTAQAVSKWENDQSCPDITMVPRLAEVFAITTDELLGVVPREAPPTEAEPPVQETPEHPEPSKETTNWEAVKSPGAAFGTWLFLTGLVLGVARFRSMLIGIEDIAIACSIFTFGLFGFLRRFSVLWLGCAVAGGLFVLNILLNAQLGDIDWTIPLAGGLALFGLDLLIGTIRKPKKAWNSMPHGHQPEEAAKNSFTCEGSRFACATRFGEGDRLVQLPILTGGSGDVTFGELTIDLSGCAQIENGCRIDLKCTFGSLEILIPRKYRVEAASHSAFGVVEEKGTMESDAEVTLYLDCSVRFGEITIRHI